MLVTSAEANKLLKGYKKDLETAYEIERRSKVFTAASIENVEDARPSYDFDETRIRIEELENKIRKIKHAINLFNINTIIPEFNMTIDEMLIYIPQLTKVVEKYEEMVNHLPKERLKTGFNNSSVEYEYINYDANVVNKFYDEKRIELARAQNAIDLINSTVKFEI